MQQFNDYFNNIVIAFNPEHVIAFRYFKETSDLTVSLLPPGGSKTLVIVIPKALCEDVYKYLTK